MGNYTVFLVFDPSGWFLISTRLLNKKYGALPSCNDKAFILLQIKNLEKIFRVVYLDIKWRDSP